jgi:oxygen-independent coproporphyrinogen III oxidase
MKFGIYLHIPFCHARCNYCHFVIRPWRPAAADRYWRALIRELDRYFSDNPLREIVDSVYFGGGTPSIIPEEQVESICTTLRRHITLSPDCEISLEANPGSLTESKAAAYFESGFNRISLGAQCFDDAELASIGRDHTAAQISESFEILRKAGFRNINLDLMLGLPAQGKTSWVRNLEKTLALAPEHVSVYMLDLDDKSPLFHRARRGEVALPEDDDVADWYLGTIDTLVTSEYSHYEISNFARAGYESRHNLKYWLRHPVLGFGVGAHSWDGRNRYANHSGFPEYLTAVESGRSPVQWTTETGSRQALQESLFLGLRLTAGVDWSSIESGFPAEMITPYRDVLWELREAGLVDWTDSNVRLTGRGILLSNEVFQRFV